MLTDIQMRNIRAAKSKSTFPSCFILQFDREWNEIQEFFKNQKVDLSKITIVPKENQ